MCLGGVLKGFLGVPRQMFCLKQFIYDWIDCKHHISGLPHHPVETFGDNPFNRLTEYLIITKRKYIQKIIYFKYENEMKGLK